MGKFVEICFAIFYLVVIHSVSALRCYSCSITSHSSDTMCLNDPVNVVGQSVVNCNRKYCTILRQELKDPAGRISSFVRGCEEVPTLLNDMIDDPMFRTYYQSCTTDLCNDGDGTTSLKQLKFSPDGYTGENLIVPGLPFNSSNHRRLNISIIISILLITAINKLIRL